MTQGIVLGVLFGMGIMLLLRGLRPPQSSLAEQLTDFADHNVPEVEFTESFNSLREELAVKLLTAVKGETIDDLRADVAVAGVELEALAVDKLNAAAGGALLLAVLAVGLGFVSGLLTIVLIGVAGGGIAFMIPSADLKKKATQRRVEFEETLNAFVSLVAVSMTGGGGLATAMADTASIGSSWVFDTLRTTIEEAVLHGDSLWSAFDSLGRRLKLVGLIEFAGALSLAGNSGARVTDTLLARAESGRKRELATLLGEAEKRSGSMGVPIGLMLLGWIGFLVYPAIAGLTG